MKTITKNLIYFALFFLIGAIIFRYGLSFFLDTRSYNLVWVIAGIYFIFNYLIGWFFGKRDYETLPLYNIGFRFHLVTYLLFNSVSLLWFTLGFHSTFERIEVIYITAIIWGFLLLVHFVFYYFSLKNSIKGISKEEIFE
jgi:hypothetical protein